ncbi:MAG: GH92 family glycosyl hydrolase [Marinilabiliales bacterium]|nr:GH92 family glycosyl hydrolase [Marinilabiliales bacterium]
MKNMISSRKIVHQAKGRADASALLSRSIRILLLTTLFFATSLAMGQTSNLSQVDPTIGNVGILLQPTRPTVHQPNQMIRFYPVRADYIDDQISFFPFTISSHRKGELFGIMPYQDELKATTWSKRQTYDHDLEVTTPYYYSTYFVDNDIKTEFTPGAKCGFFKFHFSTKGEKFLALRIVNQGSWQMDGPQSNPKETTFEGTEEFMGMKAFVFGVVQGQATTGQIDLPSADAKRSNAPFRKGAWIRFPAGSPDEILVKYALSFISPEQARENLKAELPGWDFAELQKVAETKWQRVMNQIQVKGGSPAQRRVFYTSLYRQYERMININEHGRYFSGYDHQVHKTDRDFYVDDWIWDTYLAMHPLRSILHPNLEGDMLQSYVTMYEQGGWMPQFPLVFMDDPAMNGFHSSITLLDGYRKNIRNFDANKAFEGMLKNATSATMLPWKNGPKCRLDSFYREKGFYPALWPGQTETVKAVHDFEKRESVAITLAASYDDWAVSQMATELHKPDLAEYYKKQSLNYRNLYRADKGLMWPKDSAGNWIDIDPKFDGGPGGRDYYDENNGYTYAWQAQHDLRGLIGLMGGNKSFTAKLDQLFREPLGRSKFAFWAKFPDATAMVGQYSMGNEPSFFIPYLYNYSGEPWKTQKRIRFLLDVWYKDNIFGIPGDEDGGGMTAFVVFSSMGFYPVTPGVPVYNIGSPLFEEVKIALENGKSFTIKANGCNIQNKYVQSAKLNGQPLTKTWFTHDDLMKGAILELQMGPLPNKSWGAGEGDAPPAGGGY